MYKSLDFRPGDSLTMHQGRPFSTRDSAVSDQTCAKTCLGGWWYITQGGGFWCGESDLNGLYKDAAGEKYIMWKNDDESESIKASTIKIRPLDFIEGIYL